ncbi:hypothetical protein Q4E93_12255 [Flavitalea sp. BT771]|uniref:hypothetical protein n=1 Tax=Flavitalea sp. BT771 TaxID=3063329 RepID=UPI0026E1AAD7|nr:hypothetical protein [Flavitalea sp. BT771]MDO6431367.1 hypothetical protein [Flavitalea sp. BT771]MDV6220275.1 hypothetical protein [Flavitalea sp. BT771]
MLFPLSWKDKLIAFLATAVLLTTVAKADSRIFLYSSLRNSHISGIYSLYIDKDTGWLSPVGEKISSRYVRKERNSDLSIVVPTPHGRYRIRFFDSQDRLLFEIRLIRDSLLIVEKANFRHAGLFQYELYKDNALVERKTFMIKSNP